MQNTKILISGGGIAGLTVSYWLNKHGFDLVIIEVAPGLREGGYMIDFWGVGYTVAERMGIIPLLEKEQDKYRMGEIKFVDGKNRQISGIKTDQLREMVHGRYFNLLRSGLENTLYTAIEGQIPVRFDTTIQSMHQDGEKASVTYNNGEKETFDLLIGADGLRSNTRRLVFGPDDNYERFLQYYTAAYTIENFTGQNKLFLSFTIPNKQVDIYDAGGHHLSTFFIFKAKENQAPNHIQDKQQKLVEAFQDVEWYTPELLKRLPTADDFYFDAVSQIDLSVWHKGRVALVGDACQAVSLISGQGSSLAMAGAYILAGELKKHQGDYTKAFVAYQQIMKPEILRKQKSARAFSKSFVPSTNFGVFTRNIFTKLLNVSFISRYFVNKFISEKINMGTY